MPIKTTIRICCDLHEVDGRRIVLRKNDKLFLFFHCVLSADYN